jgi:hypothetical protein
MISAGNNIRGSWNQLKRMGFMDEAGDYGYDGKYVGIACHGLSDSNEVLACANDKHAFKNDNESDNENRKKFALMDIKEACDRGNLCFGKDDDDIDIPPNDICVLHNACPIPGTTIKDVYYNYKQFYKELGDSFWELFDPPVNEEPPTTTKTQKAKIKEKMIDEMVDIINEYNSLPYPIGLGSDSMSGSMNGHQENNTDSLPCDQRQISEIKKLLPNIFENLNNTYGGIAASKNTKNGGGRYLKTKINNTNGDVKNMGVKNTFLKRKQFEGDSRNAGKQLFDRLGPLKIDEDKAKENLCAKYGKKSSQCKAKVKSEKMSTKQEKIYLENKFHKQVTDAKEYGATNKPKVRELKSLIKNKLKTFMKNNEDANNYGKTIEELIEQYRKAIYEPPKESHNEITVTTGSNRVLTKLNSEGPIYESKLDSREGPIGSNSNAAKINISVKTKNGTPTGLLEHLVDDEPEDNTPEEPELKTSGTKMVTNLGKSAKIHKMNRWYENWMNEENLEKRAALGCDNTFFFTSQGNTNNFTKLKFTPDNQPTPQEIKEYWIKKFTSEFQGKEIANEEVEDLKEEQKESKDSATPEGKQRIKQADKMMEKKKYGDLPGVDLSCDMLDMSMLDILDKKSDPNWVEDKANTADKSVADYKKTHPKLGAIAYGVSGPATGTAKLASIAIKNTSKSLVNSLSSASNGKITYGSSKDIENKGKELLQFLPVGSCVCKHYIPTGIFEFDWKYYRMCFLNFKQLIKVARTQGEEPEFIEKRLRQLFIADFFENFGGDFLQYRELLLKFDLNYRKLCMLKNKNVPFGDARSIPKVKYLAMKLRTIDGPLKDMEAKLKEKKRNKEYLEE